MLLPWSLDSDTGSLHLSSPPSTQLQYLKCTLDIFLWIYLLQYKAPWTRAKQRRRDSAVPLWCLITCKHGFRRNHHAYCRIERPLPVQKLIWRYLAIHTSVFERLKGLDCKSFEPSIVSAIFIRDEFWILHRIYFFFQTVNQLFECTAPILIFNCEILDWRASYSTSIALRQSSCIIQYSSHWCT